MPDKKIVVGLFVAIMLVSTSTAAAQPPDPPSQSPPTSVQTEQDHFHLSLSPTEVQAGGAIRVQLSSDYPLDATCGGQATSPGFVAPITLNFASHTTHTGEGLVIDEPGTYQATVPCTSGSSLTASFAVVGSPSTSQPTNPPPTIVKPIGAPQTGGGGTS
jgi:hypothetical protein